MRRARGAVEARCVLDSGGLTALLGRSQRARAWYRWILDHGGTVWVPTPILTEATTGDAAKEAEVNRILILLSKLGRFVAPDESIARAAGRLRYQAHTDDGIDALVAATAASSGAPCVLLTSDSKDLGRLLSEEEQVTVVQV